MAYSPVLNPQPVTPDSVSDNLTTSGSVTSQTTVVSVSNAGFNGGTFYVSAAGASNLIVFEQSTDNANWATMLCATTNAPSAALVASTATAGFFYYSSSMAYVRARVSSYTSGTVTVSITQKRSASSVLPISLAAPYTAGTNIGTVTVTGGGATAVNVSADNVVDNLVTSGSVTAASNVVSVSTTGYMGGSFQVTNAGTTCTITYEQSNDNTNWVTLAVNAVASATSVPVTTSTAVGIYTYSTAAAFVRARVSTYTSGTVAVSLVQKRASPPISGLSLAGGSAAIGSINTVTNGNVGFPNGAADVASAAITSTTTTSTFTPTYGCSYEVNIPVTVVSGTTPTMDVVVQESDDSGTNWFDVYHFPRITATGMYRSPKMPLTGNRVRYVQTIAGTTPSFTRAINRLQSSDTAQPLRRWLDRTLASAQALNATTATFTVLSATRDFQLTISTSVVTTTAPAIQLQGSEDGGVSWYLLGSPLTAVTASTVQATVNNVNAELVRAIVTTAGVSTTLNYVAIKAF